MVHRQYSIIWILILSMLAMLGCVSLGVNRSKKAAQTNFASPLIYIGPSTFQMGSREGQHDEYPIHEVEIDGYYIEKYEVSYKQYYQCVEAGACREPAYTHDFSDHPDLYEHPVVGVTWNDAETYCQWIDRRLPTEAEWEYAAKGDNNQSYPWGHAHLPEYTNTRGDDDGYLESAPVKEFKKGASSKNILQMSGNAAEWVYDYYSEDFYAKGSHQNPKGASSGREKIVRGGSYQDPPYNVRASSRNSLPPTKYSQVIGFRCAK